MADGGRVTAYFHPALSWICLLDVGISICTCWYICVDVSNTRFLLLFGISTRIGIVYSRDIQHSQQVLLPHSRRLSTQVMEETEQVGIEIIISQEARA